MITQEEAHNLFEYDPVTGSLRYRSNGKIAGSSQNGYRRVKIKGKKYLVHRIIWLMVYGEWPSNHLDHRDCNRSNNRLENLRLANPHLNKANEPVRIDNLLQRKGVTFHRQTRKYQARIFVNGKSISLGLHHTIDDAAAAYAEAARKHFGEFARLS